MCREPGHVTIPRSLYGHLSAHYFSPLSGMRDIAAGLIDEWGHDPEAHPELLAEMEIELSGALVETAADLMRDRGLPDLRVEPAALPVQEPLPLLPRPPYPTDRVWRGRTIHDLPTGDLT